MSIITNTERTAAAVDLAAASDDPAAYVALFDAILDRFGETEAATIGEMADRIMNEDGD